MELLVTTGQGPAECAVFLERAVPQCVQRLESAGFRVEVVWGKGHARILCEGPCDLSDWVGTWEWCAKSPLRPTHKRSRWFVQASLVNHHVQLGVVVPEQVVYQVMRAGGPGGQHQNKRESAVRATWTAPDGRVYVAVARDERSQHQNKRLALERLCEQVAKAGRMKEEETSEHGHRLRKQVQRGGAVKTFEGGACILVN